MTREVMTREERAEKVWTEVLSRLGPGEALSNAEIARRTEGTTHAVRRALSVLEAQGRATRVANGGWAAEADLASRAVPIAETSPPYRYVESIPIEHMFVDMDYQRPITAFVERIVAHFDPRLYAPPFVSERAPNSFAIFDGQTRLTGRRRLGFTTSPGLVYRDLSREEEAELCDLFQSERRGHTPWHKFKVALAQGETTERGRVATRVKELCDSVGYQLGDATGLLNTPGALTACYRRDDFLLERTLMALHAAFPDQLPRGTHIRGLHYWFWNPKHMFRPKGAEVDDARLVRRLGTAGLDGIHRRANAAREYGQGEEAGKRAQEFWIAKAIQAIYAGSAP